MAKKIATVFLCVLFVYSYLLYYAIACFQLSSIGNEVDEFRLKGDYTSCDLVLFSFKKTAGAFGSSDLKWKSEKEFSCQNSLYDVIDKIETEDSLFLYCLNDEMENELLFYIERHVKGFIEQENESNEKSSFKFLLKDFICHSIEQEEFSLASESIKPNTDIAFHFFSKVLSKESPPPERF